MRQDSELKKAFKTAGAMGGLRDSCSLIASMHKSPGPLGRSVDAWQHDAQPRASAQNTAAQAPTRPNQSTAAQDTVLMRDVTNQLLKERCRPQQQPAARSGPAQNSGQGSQEHSGITPLLGETPVARPYTCCGR